MTSDASAREPAPSRIDLWRLPQARVVDQQIRQYPEARISYRGTERIEHGRALEIVVETSEPFVARAITPVLYIGETEVREWEMEGPNRYRFFAYDADRYEPGAPIGLGWPDAGAPELETGSRVEPRDESSA